MNFLIWLLKRMKNTIFGGKWGWLHKYREAIKEEMPIAIIATIGCGLLWFLIAGLITLYFIEDRATLQIAMKCVIACPPLFFVYNWLYTLYEIYDAERMAVWEELKR